MVKPAKRRRVDRQVHRLIRQAVHHFDAIAVVHRIFIPDHQIDYSHEGTSVSFGYSTPRSIRSARFISSTRFENMASAALDFFWRFSSTDFSPSGVTLSERTVRFCPNRQHRRTPWLYCSKECEGNETVCAQCWKFKPHAPIFGLVTSTRKSPLAKARNFSSLDSSESHPLTCCACGMIFSSRSASTFRWHQMRAGSPVSDTREATFSQRSRMVRRRSSRCSWSPTAGIEKRYPGAVVWASTWCCVSISGGRTKASSANPRSDGRRTARAQEHTQRQNGISSCPLNRHFAFSASFAKSRIPCR